MGERLVLITADPRGAPVRDPRRDANPHPVFEPLEHAFAIICAAAALVAVAARVVWDLWLVLTTRLLKQRALAAATGADSPDLREEVLALNEVIDVHDQVG